MHDRAIRLGLVATIAGYEILIVGDTVVVSQTDDDRIVTTQRVAGLAQFVRAARELRVTLAAFPAFEVVYIVDLAQQSYGYAVNVQVPAFSEWGYAPLGR
jgi:hypothetical protein